MIGQTISHYRILSQIGEGGMGVVYVAEDTRLGRRVAIKFPHADADEKRYRTRFLREARAVSALAHKNIAAVYDYGETAARQPYIVMELVVGQTLADVLLGTGLSLARAVEIIEEVASALAEAHRRGVVHRDIKPSNVLIDERGQVKVLDFGLAKQLDEENGAASSSHAQTLLETHTRSDVIIGTPLYLSPEQARGARVDGRSDIFALGALLYECIAGRPAFSGANVIEIGAQVLHINPSPPSHFNSRVTPELDRVTLKALAKKTEDRYQTADEMAADLKSARAKFSISDTTRTRRLTTATNLLRSSAFITISDKLRRPRLSPLAFFIALVIGLLGIWVITTWHASAHQPQPAAREAYERGMSAMRAGAYYKAGREFEATVALDDKYALAHARLAESRAELDYLDQAKDELLVVNSLVPERAALDALDALYLDAIAATIRRDYPVAVHAYEEIARRAPETAQVYLDLGRAYEKTAETDKAIASCVKATNLEPQSPTAFLRLGILYGRKRDLASANSTFEKAESLYLAAGDTEGRTEVFYQRGYMHNIVNNLAEARQNLEQALELARANDYQYQRVLSLLALSSVVASNKQLAEAERDAREAVEYARANSMFNLTARGLIDLGNVYFAGGDYPKAEDYFRQAIEQAERYGVRPAAARAQLSLGSVLVSQLKTDEALPHLQKAQTFYEQGGLRGEVALSRTLRARALRLSGDYAGALASFEQFLKDARASNDSTQIIFSLNDVGRILALQSRHTDALKYFEESYSIAKASNDQPNMGHCLVNRAVSLWHLGLYADAESQLKAVDAITSQQSNTYRALEVEALHCRFEMALSQRRFADVKTLTVKSLALSEGKFPDIVIEARRALGLALSQSGAKREGREMCARAVSEAQATGDQIRLATLLIRAEADLEDGDADAALTAATELQESFARAGQTELEWRACVVAARACLVRDGSHSTDARHYAAHAAELLNVLQQQWGDEAYGSFLARPDIQFSRKQLGSISN